MNTLLLKIAGKWSLMSLILLTGCTTGEKMSRIETGMSRQQVIAILGRPDEVSSQGQYERLGFTHRLITGWSWDRTDFNVVLKDGKVLQYGHGEIRDRSPRMIYHSGSVQIDQNINHSGTIFVDQW